MTFEQLELTEPVRRALKEEGYTTPTPIQAQAIPHLLQQRDLLGCAQTGTGKTAAFAIPILQLLYLNKGAKPQQGKRIIKSLIVTPTRELAIQIGESFDAYGKYTGLRNTVIFGGVPQHKQTNALAAGVDILIATPGRLLDLINQKFISLNQIEFFVLDEADRMLDMGFVHDVKKLITMLPKKRQSLFFSATMPPAIVTLANTILHNPVKVEVTPVSSTADTIRQTLYHVNRGNKIKLLLHLLKNQEIETALVFARTKHGADRVCKTLNQNGIKAEAIHGNKAQNARQRALSNFKSKETRILVATDIAARGIDVDDLQYVINYEMPNVPETYVHRIGRTGRAGAKGSSYSFCDHEEVPYVKDIQKLIGKAIPVVNDHPYPFSAEAVTESKESKGDERKRSPRPFANSGRPQGNRPKKTFNR